MIRFLRSLPQRSLYALMALILLIPGGIGIAVTDIGVHAPDVWAHVYRISGILHGDVVAHPVSATSEYHCIASENVGGRVSFDLIELSIENAGRDNSAIDADSVVIASDGSVEAPFNNTAVYNPVAYLPQLMAFAAGDALDIPAAAKYYLAEFAMLLTYALVGAAAFVALPRHRWVAAAVLLFPGTWYTFSFAISADSFSLVLSILFSCLTYRCVSTRPTTRDCWALGLTGLLMASTKFSNAPLFALALPLVMRKGELRKTYPIAACFLAAVVVDVAWMKLGTSGFATSPAVVPFDLVAQRTSEGLALLPTICQHMLYSAIHAEGSYRFGTQGVAVFWLGFVACLAAAAVTAAYARSPRSETGTPRFFWLYACLVVFAFAFVTYAALWLQYTPDGVAGVDGVQYRYFLPALPICILLLIDCVRAFQARRTAAHSPAKTSRA